jgi:hypothetical protein
VEVCERYLNFPDGHRVRPAAGSSCPVAASEVVWSRSPRGQTDRSNGLMGSVWPEVGKTVAPDLAAKAE